MTNKKNEKRAKYFENLIEKNQQLNKDWSNMVEKTLEKEEKTNAEYKQSEQQRIITIVYGTGLANVWAIFSLEQNPNIAFFVTSLIWALMSYMIWFYSERMAFRARTHERKAYFEQNCMVQFKSQLDFNNMLSGIVKNEIDEAEDDDKNYLESELNSLKERISYNNEQIKFSENMSEELIDQADQNNKLAYRLGKICIPVLFIAWLAGIAGILVNFYMRLTYLPKFFGSVMMGFSFVMAGVLVVYGFKKSMKISLPLKEKRQMDKEPKELAIKDG